MYQEIVNLQITTPCRLYRGFKEIQRNSKKQKYSYKHYISIFSHVSYISF